MSNSLLGYLISRIGASPEPAATQALAYILRSSEDVGKAFATLVSQTGVTPVQTGRIAAEERYGDCIPDLTIKDTADAVRIFVENKFWAGLTEAQPGAYLDELPAEGVLLFIVPHRRIPSVWGELKARCRRGVKQRDLSGESKADHITWARTESRTLAVTSWKHVLDRLREAAHDGGHTSIAQDIIQLRGLTDKMNADEFLPLRADEVTDVNVACRLINYKNLVEDIIHPIVQDGIAERKAKSQGFTWSGRWVLLHGKFSLWIGVTLGSWREYGVSPLWWETEDGLVGFKGRLPAVSGLFDEAQLNDGRTKLRAPINLTPGVERQRVVDDAVEQMRRVAATLLNAFPD